MRSGACARPSPAATASRPPRLRRAAAGPPARRALTPRVPRRAAAQRARCRVVRAPTNRANIILAFEGRQAVRRRPGLSALGCALCGERCPGVRGACAALQRLTTAACSRGLLAAARPCRSGWRSAGRSYPIRPGAAGSSFIELGACWGCARAGDLPALLRAGCPVNRARPGPAPARASCAAEGGR